MSDVLSVEAPKPNPTGDFPLQSFGTGLQVTGGGNPLALGHQVNNTLLMGANSLLNNSGRTNFTNKQLTELEKVSPSRTSTVVHQNTPNPTAHLTSEIQSSASVRPTGL